MIRKSRTYLIDFNISAKMNEPNELGTFNFMSRRTHKKGHSKTARDDWEGFLYTMCKLNKVKLGK